MIKIAICDDNAEELSEIASLMEEYRSTQPIEYEYTLFHNSFEMATFLGKGSKFDIYCLDIIMPGYSGIELAKEIRSFDKNAQIFFFTSSAEFALDSYSVRATNYVLKPITKEKLFCCLNDAFERIAEDRESAIIVKSTDGIQKILLSKLVFVEAMGRKNLYHLVSGRVIACISPFSATCETLLAYRQFIKPHRSFLVNMSYIDIIRKSAIALQTGASVPIAQGKSKEVKEYYLAFQMKE